MKIKYKPLKMNIPKIKIPEEIKINIKKNIKILEDENKKKGRGDGRFYI